MKPNNFSIKWKLFFYMLIFVFILLVVLWLFQTVLLNDFYKLIKTKQLESIVDTIVKNIDSDDLYSFIEQIEQRDTKTTIMIVNDSGDIIYPVYPNGSLTFHKTILGHDEFIDKINEENSLYFEKRFIEPPLNPNLLPHGSSDVHRFALKRNAPGAREPESMISVAKTFNSNGAVVYIMIVSQITPVDATVETLKYQLVLISIILLVFALIIALLISKRFASPIMEINESAKQLSLGNYDIKFYANSYREINELSDTLNKAAYELSMIETFRRDLIANVSHDLRTPLTMIIGFAEMIRDLPGENTPENAQIIINESNYLKRLVSELLNISRTSSFSVERDKSVFSLSNLVKDNIDRIKEIYSQTGDLDINFDVSINADVCANEMEISQVIYNLITNAIDYSDDIVTVRQLIKGDKVVIEVCDKGQGISKKDLPYVWDRYYKTSAHHKRSIVGTGLGLSIVKSVITRYNGRYGVKSKEGEGSVFWFELDIV